MRTLIVGKTHMRKLVCIGGLMLEDNTIVRLLQPDRSNHPIDTNFAVGQIWDIEFQTCQDLRPPHVEDILLTNKKYICDQKEIKKVLLPRIAPWKGDIDTIYDGLLRFTQNGSGYISERAGVPAVSTGYWIINEPLYKDSSNEDKIRYIYENENSFAIGRFNRKYISYVGFQTPIDIIPKDTLVRVSLARWWAPKDAIDLEERCYLQLSGWFL